MNNSVIYGPVCGMRIFGKDSGYVIAVYICGTLCLDYLKSVIWHRGWNGTVCLYKVLQPSEFILRILERLCYMIQINIAVLSS